MIKTYVSTTCRRGHIIKVLKSAAGYYIGTEEDSEPYCRLSEEYYTTEEKAQEALVTGFNPRICMENGFCSEGKGCFQATLLTEEDIVFRLLKEVQQFDHIPACPRCGGPMPDKAEYAALSRRVANIYICSCCGKEEAVLDYLGNPDLLIDWAIMKHVRDMQGTSKG